MCPARQGESVDQWGGGVLPGQPHQAAEALQVHCDLCHHAGQYTPCPDTSSKKLLKPLTFLEKWSRPSHSELLLLG